MNRIVVLLRSFVLRSIPALFGAIVLGSGLCAVAQDDGTLDTSFGAAGFTSFGFEDTSAVAYDIKRQFDQDEGGILALDSSGVLRDSFGTNGVADSAFGEESGETLVALSALQDDDGQAVLFSDSENCVYVAGGAANGRRFGVACFHCTAPTPQPVGGETVPVYRLYSYGSAESTWTGEGIQYYVCVEDMAFYEESTGNWYIPGEAGASTTSNLKSQIAPSDSPSSYTLLRWGGPGFLPDCMDFDGDGIDDLAVYHEETALWFVCTVDGEILLWEAGDFQAGVGVE